MYAYGSIWAWGSDLVRQYGAGMPDVSRKPVQVTVIAGAAAVAKGRDFTAVFGKDGRVQGLGTTIRASSETTPSSDRWCRCRSLESAALDT